MMVGAPQYRIARARFWMPHVGCYTVAVLWPAGETAQQVAIRFVNEAERVFLSKRPAARPRFRAVEYMAPLQCVKGMTL